MRVMGFWFFLGFFLGNLNIALGEKCRLGNGGG